MHITLTTSRIEKVGTPTLKDAFYRDTGTTGFGLKVTPGGTKSFFVEAREKSSGKMRRVVLGRYRAAGDPQAEDALTLAEATAMAHRRLAQLTDRTASPVSRQHAPDAPDSFTLSQVFDAYMDAADDLKPSTRAGYRHHFGAHLKELAKLPIEAISFDNIRDLARRVAAGAHGKPSTANANSMLRLLRALLNFAAADLKHPNGAPALPANPFPSRVGRHSKRKLMHRPVRRSSVIARDDLPTWWQTVDGLSGARGSLQAEVARDYLQTLLLTGLRKMEGAQLRVSNVDMRGRVFLLGDTKNWREHALPLSTPLVDIFARRIESAKATKCDWLFPNKFDGGPFAQSMYWTRRVRDESGLKFTLHDLRRTFATVADSVGVGGFTLKRLMNHAAAEADITGSYVVRNVERLREPMQRIADAILGMVQP